MRAHTSTLLLELLRGNADRATDDAEWMAVFKLACEHQLLPWAAACLRSRPEFATRAISGRLKEIEREAAITAFYWSSELVSVLHAFQGNDVVVVPLKGPFLAERLYGSTALRVSYDLDLLVSKNDLSRAEVILASIGFIPGTPDDYHRSWYRNGSMVELHHDVENPLAFDFHVDGALRRVRRASFQGQRCWQLAPEDELLYLCLHAVRHRFGRLSLVLDLSMAFKRLPQASEVWQPRSEVADLGSLLTLGLAMARQLQPDLTIALPVTASVAQDPRLELLADQLWGQLLMQPTETLDWQTLHSFYMEVEVPGTARFRRRLRHLQILLNRVIEPDYRFAARVGLHKGWQVYLLRPLRLLCDRMREV